MLGDSGARAVFAENGKHAETISGVRGSTPALEHIWLIDGTDRPDSPPTLDSLTASPGAADVTDEQLEQQRTARKRGRPGHDHLHLGHDRPPEGLRAHSPQPARRRTQRGPGRARRGLRDLRQLDPAVHAARALVRPDHPGRLPGVRRHPRALAGHQHRGPGAARVPAHVPAGRAAGVREGLQQRAAAGGGQQGRRPGSSRPPWRRPSPGARPWTARTADAAHRGSGTRCSTGSSTPSSGRPSAARCSYAVSGGAPLGERLGHFFRGAGDHDSRGLRPDRDLGRRDREQAEPQQDRHRRPAAARRRHQDRRRRRDPAPGPERLPRLLAQRPRPPPRRSTPTAGCTPATSAAWTTRASCGSPGGRRSSSSPRAARTSRPPCSRTGCAPTR